MKRRVCAGPRETPDSNGSVRARKRRAGFCAKTKLISTIEAGIRSAKLA